MTQTKELEMHLTFKKIDSTNWLLTYFAFKSYLLNLGRDFLQNFRTFFNEWKWQNSINDRNLSMLAANSEVDTQCFTYFKRNII